MIVMCEGCESSFQVEDRLIKSTGSKVRCSKCRHVFVAYSPAALAVAEEPLILSEELPVASSAGVGSDLPDISSQIDALFADDFGVAANTPSDQEPELIDVEDLLEDDSPPAAVLTTGMTDDDLKLDLDLDLNFDEEATAQSPPGEPPAKPLIDDFSAVDFASDVDSVQDTAPGDTLASLDELGIKLDSLEGMGAEGIPAAANVDEPAVAETPELDLYLDLNALVAETAEELIPEPSAAESKLASSDEPPDTLAGPPIAEVPAAKQPANEGELDLSDLEAMLEGDMQAIEPQRAVTVELDLELDAEGVAVDRREKGGDFEELDLTEITGETAGNADLVETAEGQPAEIDLALDLDDGPIAAPDIAASDTPPDDELDFSDITTILEEPIAEPEKETADAAPELDLFLGDSLPQAEPEAPASKAEVQEGLLLDIESLLEEEDTSEAAAEQKPAMTTEELDLEMALGSAPATADDLEIEIESIPEGSESSVPAEHVAVAGATGDEPAAAPDQFSLEAITGAHAAATDTIDMESAAVAALAAEAPRHSGLRKFLVAAAAVLVLLAAAVIVPRGLEIEVPFLSDIEVPFLGKIFQSQPEDLIGNLKMAPIAENLTAEFIDHPGGGRLVVIRGQVRNNYDHPRSAVRVTAKLYTKDKTLAKTATIFAGNLLSNQELAAQDIAAVNARLKTKEGANNLNVGVKPGRSVPFMAVFDKLPDNLDEYSVEVAGSTK